MLKTLNKGLSGLFESGTMEEPVDTASSAQ
jgi:hypothetical protein